MPRKKHQANDNNLAICYYRFSSHSQNEASIEQQRDAAHKWATAKGFTIIKEYEDRAISGTTSDRPGYQQMLFEVSKIRPAVLVLWKADRLGRDRFEVALARKTLSDAGCRVCYVAEAVPDDDSPEAALMESMLDGMADYYSRQLARNIRRGVEYNAKHALSNGHKLLGYSIGEDKRYVIDDKTAPVIRRIFSEYVAGKRLGAIADELNAEGLRTVRGGPFNVHGLRRILKNKRYTGVYTYGDVEVEGGMPAIVDKNTFEAAQKRFAQNKRDGARVAREVDQSGADRYWLTGKLFCGECGHSMQGTYGTSKGGRRYDYYGCGNHLKARGCRKKNVSKGRIESAVTAILSKLLDDNELLASFAADAAAYYQETYGDDSYVRGLEADLKDVEKSIANIIKAVEAGMFSETLISRLSELERQKSALTDAIETERAKAALMADERGIARTFERYAHANLDDPEVRDDVLEYFIDKVYVYDDRLLITGDFTDYVGDDRYRREHYWTFDDYEADFASSGVFDLGEFSSTKYDRVPLPGGARFFVRRKGQSPQSHAANCRYG